NEHAHRRCRRRVDQEHPRRRVVRAAAEPVQQRGRPDGEVQVVRAPPEPIREAAAIARPVQSGRYRAVRGTITWSGENGRYESIATVRTCRATKNPTSSPPKRCTSSTANFGHL